MKLSRLNRSDHLHLFQLKDVAGRSQQGAAAQFFFVFCLFVFLNSHSCIIDSWAQNTKHESFHNREAWQEPQSRSRNGYLQFDEWNVSPWGGSCGRSGWTSPYSFFPLSQATYVLLALAWVFVPVYISSGVGWFAHTHAHTLTRLSAC